MAPVILRLRRGRHDEVRILSTGQHRSLLDRALADFDLAADDDLDLMRPDQTLADLTARAVTAALASLRGAEARPGPRPGRYHHGLLRRPGLLLPPHPVRAHRGRAADGPALFPISRGEEPGAGRAPGRGPFCPHRGGEAQSAPRGDRPDERPRDGQHRDRCAPDDGRTPSHLARRAEHAEVPAGDGAPPREFRRSLAGDLPRPPRPGTALSRLERRLPGPPESTRSPGRRRACSSITSGST